MLMQKSSGTHVELREKEKAEAVQLVSQTNELTANAIRGNATLQANPELAEQVLAALEQPAETAK